MSAASASSTSSVAGKTAVFTADAPKPIGPYSQAVRVGDFLYVCGCIGMDPKSGALTSSDVSGQCVTALNNLKAIVEAAGLSLSNVVKTTLFLRDMAHFAAVNEIYTKYFPTDSIPPARSTVAVVDLPKSALFEIECVAIATQQK